MGTQFEIGLMFWANEPTEPLQKLGFRHGQLGVPGDFPLTGGNRWAGYDIRTVFAAFHGESYADRETVESTVGFVPRATRAEREQRMLEVSDFARELGVGSIATHIGFVKPDDAEMREVVRRICDRASENGQTFALETGQEPAAELLEFMREVDRPNLGINFDPANMVMYGSGDPIEALRLLAPHVLSVHCKDGTWPSPPRNLGNEMRLGDGDVGIPRFIEELRTMGYNGPLFIEREADDRDARLRDLEYAARLLTGLAGQ